MDIKRATSLSVTGIGAKTGRTEMSPAPGKQEEPTLDSVTVRLKYSHPICFPLDKGVSYTKATARPMVKGM